MGLASDDKPDARPIFKDPFSKTHFQKCVTTACRDGLSSDARPEKETERKKETDRYIMGTVFMSRIQEKNVN